jgi:phosphoglycolate phosphatase-like HAD superfamily hydrolase
MPLRPTAALAAALILTAAQLAADPLPSWAEGEAKARIVAFVERVTDPASPDYVTPDARIAAFDNDGTLWAEQPFYFQFLYAMDRFREAAEADPSLLTSDATRAAAEGDLAGALAGGQEALLEIVAASHADRSVEDFQADVRDWLDAARHPDTGRPYDEMLYQPMLELLRYLRDEGFQTWIVSGGGIDFIRTFAGDAYNIPPQQVVGTRAPARYDEAAREVVKEPGIEFLDDKAGKPVAIALQIGRRPIFVGGNSDGDFEMLDYATSGDGPSFGLIVHHTDGEREFAYDRGGPVGALERGLDEGPERGWVIVDMARDWEQVFAE